MYEKQAKIIGMIEFYKKYIKWGKGTLYPHVLSPFYITFITNKQNVYTVKREH